MRRPVLALSLALLATPLSLVSTLPALAQEVVVEPNRQMKAVLPDDPDGWDMGDIRVATGALPMYSVATAEATYKKGNIQIVVGAARSPTLYKAVMGSIKVPSTLPPNGTVEVVNGKKAIVTAYPEAKVPLYQIQIAAGVDGIVMLTTRTGTLDDLRAMAKEVDFDPFPIR